jgi:4'-phosphopantetheinyl transferase EntD
MMARCSSDAVIWPVRQGSSPVGCPEPSGSAEQSHKAMIGTIRHLLPPGAAVAGGGLDIAEGTLFPEEESAIRGAVAIRRREFAAGRYFARQALLELGHAPCSIPVRPSRAPDWPSGFVGTISHTRSLCIAATAYSSNLTGIGIDIEERTALSRHLVPMVCRPGELADWCRIERMISADMPKLVFVAKEAFYKLYFPLAETFIDFQEVEIVVDPVAFTFQARLIAARLPSFAGRRQVWGRLGRVEETIFAIVSLAAIGVAAVPAPGGFSHRNRHRGHLNSV